METSEPLLPNPDALRSYLLSFEIPLTLWDKSGTKSVEELFKEIEDGKCLLFEQKEELKRYQRILAINMYGYDGKNHHILRENEQIWHDGRYRTRDLPTSLSEKLRINENANDDAVYGVMEEKLGIRELKKLSKYGSVTNSQNSSSYPGLITVRDIYLYNARIRNEDYDANVDGFIERGVDKDTYFIWELVRRPSSELY